ncbi:MAG TPA: hypothetical protein VFE98_10970 [Candidatus Bathyarchaeia archaeon]|nr:hypothetical protein [Candidatus Bathyarchaeia archaeon]
MRLRSKILYILYLDESGDPQAWEHNNFVLAGVAWLAQLSSLDNHVLLTHSWIVSTM